MNTTRDRTTRLLTFAAATICLIVPGLLAPRTAAADDAKDKKAWQKQLVGQWLLTFQGDAVKHPVTFSLNGGVLTGTYRTKNSKVLSLKGVSLVPPHPMPPGTPPYIQEDFWDCWRLYLDIPMAAPVSCNFDLAGNKNVLAGVSSYGNLGGKGDDTPATLTRKNHRETTGPASA